MIVHLFLFSIKILPYSDKHKLCRKGLFALLLGFSLIGVPRDKGKQIEYVSLILFSMFRRTDGNHMTYLFQLGC